MPCSQKTRHLSSLLPQAKTATLDTMADTTVAAPFLRSPDRIWASATPLDLLTLEEAASAAGVTKWTIVKWAARGKVTIYGKYPSPQARVSWAELFPPTDPASIAGSWHRERPGPQRRRAITSANENQQAHKPKIECEAKSTEATEPKGSSEGPNAGLEPAAGGVHPPVTQPVDAAVIAR